jgi:ATP-dependent Zn protease
VGGILVDVLDSPTFHTQQPRLYSALPCPASVIQATADEIDNEVKELVERAYRRAKDLVVENLDILHKVAGVRVV